MQKQRSLAGLLDAGRYKNREAALVDPFGLVVQKVIPKDQMEMADILKNADDIYMAKCNAAAPKSQTELEFKMYWKYEFKHPPLERIKVK